MLENHKEQSSGGVLSKDVLNIFAGVTKLQAGNLKPAEAAAGDVKKSVKQGVLKNFATFAGKNLCWSLFLIKLVF